MARSGTPTNEPTRHDSTRAARLKPVRDAVEELRLPLTGFGKISGILNPIEMQIEDGGDSPEVNRLLLEALRAAVRHQVDQRQSGKVLHSIDAFEKAEAKRREQLAAGVPCRRYSYPPGRSSTT